MRSAKKRRWLRLLLVGFILVFLPGAVYAAFPGMLDITGRVTISVRPSPGGLPEWQYPLPGYPEPDITTPPALISMSDDM